MCTVTYIPSKEGFFLTSNRDEKTTRKPAAAPATYLHDGIAMLYPKDGAAGGTWIVVAQNGNAAVLLNGAFQKHTPANPYRKSRGLVFMEIMTSKEPYLHFLQIPLDNIEPFTLVLYSNNNLYECVWDGSIRHHRPLNKQLPQIWSSVTLYEDAVIKKRQQWFAGWLQKNTLPSQNGILQFHQFTGDGDVQNDLLMNRNNTLRTVSITGIEWAASKATVKHYDLLKNEESETCILIAAPKTATWHLR
jgi:Transport and Golgi organisation 2